MKVKRHKHNKRVLKFYHTNFNFDLKYFNILIDGTFANSALNDKLNLADQLPKFFELDNKYKNRCSLFTTKCAIKETELLGKPTYGAMLILKQYNLVECQHKREFVSTEKCFKNILVNCAAEKNGQLYNKRYVVATQV
jgi:U3 small nucleolar RNA-associated protein 23